MLAAVELGAKHHRVLVVEGVASKRHAGSPAVENRLEVVKEGRGRVEIQTVQAM